MTGVAEAGTGEDEGERMGVGFPSREIFCFGRSPSLAVRESKDAFERKRKRERGQCREREED